MPLEEKMEFLKCCSANQRLAFKIVSSCAPVIKGLTSANTLTVKRGVKRQIDKQLKDTCLSCIPLYIDESKEILMVTRLDELDSYLKKEDTFIYLKEFGYLENSIEYVFKKLHYRFKKFYSKQGDFPHELGLLLNYPIEDIKGFIANNGKNSLLTKYWKVYGNIDEAIKTFKSYDEAFEKSLYEVVSGQQLKEIVA